MEANTEGDFETEAEGGTEADTEVDIEADIEPAIKADIEANTEADAEDSVRDTIENAVNVIIESDTLPAPLVPTVLERLDEHEEVTQETTELERTALRDRVRSLEISDLSLCNTLRAEREAYARIERQLGNVSKELRQSQMSYHVDRESFRRLDTFMIRHHGYHP
ncbi:hypothetical protein Tco_0550248 [Tanacetum coccineum]